jgi:hypothetical protein
MSNSSGSSRSHHVDRWLKVIGAMAVLYFAAKVIGAVLSPGMVFFAIALWLVVRSHNKRQPKPVMHILPTAAMYAPQPPRGYWMPTAAPQYGAPRYAAAQPMPQAASFVPSSAPSSVAPIIDTRSDAEREIESYVEQAWPHVKLQRPIE